MSVPAYDTGWCGAEITPEDRPDARQIPRHAGKVAGVESVPYGFQGNVHGCVHAHAEDGSFRKGGTAHEDQDPGLIPIVGARYRSIPARVAPV